MAQAAGESGWDQKPGRPPACMLEEVHEPTPASSPPNRNNAEYLVIKKLSKNIYDRILIFMIKGKKNVS